MATPNIKFTTPIEAPDIRLESDFYYTDNDAPEWRINSYFYNKQVCNYPKQWELDKNLYQPQWVCASDIFETTSESEAVLTKFVNAKKLDSAEVNGLFIAQSSNNF